MLDLKPRNELQPVFNFKGRLFDLGDNYISAFTGMVYSPNWVDVANFIAQDQCVTFKSTATPRIIVFWYVQHLIVSN